MRLALWPSIWTFVNIPCGLWRMWSLQLLGANALFKFIDPSLFIVLFKFLHPCWFFCLINFINYWKRHAEIYFVNFSPLLYIKSFITMNWPLSLINAFCLEAKIWTMTSAFYHLEFLFYLYWKNSFDLLQDLKSLIGIMHI